MFEIALAIGIFSYGIFFLGLLGLLFQPLIVVFSTIFWVGFIAYKGRAIISFLKQFSLPTRSLLFLIPTGYLIAQAVINSVGLLGPEIGFDATWYHLTLPKLYLMYHAVAHFPGGILYYSDMPKLTEMLYTAGLSFGSDFFARGIHFIFGILSCIVIYRIGRKFFTPSWAILLSVIFYSNLVVGWESVSGYIDLSRTFFTVVTLLAFITWIQTKQQKWLIFSASFLGMTIATKLLALPDIAIYTVVLLWFEHKTTPFLTRLKRIGIFILLTFSIPLPWFVFALVHTGNPVYPMLSSVYQVTDYWQILSPVYFVTSFWQTFALSSDPINPLFLTMVPFLIVLGKKLWKEVPVILLVAVGGIVAWYITPQTGGGRYILPYLPALSLLCVYTMQLLSKKWQRTFLVFIFAVAVISLFYRGAANAKILPLIFHKETEAQFMTTHLQYNLGDFYDIDGYFAKHIKPTDTVLLYNFHNLYYINFPFIDSDWVKKGDTFNYIAVQGMGMPQRFIYWNLVYSNPITQVRLYSFKGQTWYY